MAPSISNDLDSPVSLLWAHQLRREHAAIVVQLEKLQDQHAPSPSELKRSVSRAEAASAKIRKELSELRTAHQKTAQATEALRRDLQAQTTTALEVVDIRREEQRHVESLRSEMRSLTALVERQQGELAGLAVEVRRMQQSRIEGREVVQEGDEIAVLRGRLDASGQRVVEAVTVVNDSVEHHGAKEASAAPQDDVSDADTFDLDANMLTDAAAAPSELNLGPSLAMIREPTAPRCSPQPTGQPVPSIGGSMEMPPEPSLPAQTKRLDPMTPPEQVTRPEFETVQGNSTLSAYIHIADARYWEIPSSNEERFVDAFVHGLRDKRDRKKCEKKFREAGKTWGSVKGCFPIASQQCQGRGNRKVVVQKKKRVEERDKGGMQDLDATLPPTKGRTDTGSRGKTHPPLILPVPAKQSDSMMQIERHAERARLLPAPGAARKRTLAEEDDGEVEDLARGTSTAAKKRRTKREKRRQERPPSIPILPSSDDEFSRGGAGK